MVIIVVVILLVVLLSCCCCGFMGYNFVSGGLPSPDELQQRQFHFQTTTIYDRYNQPVFELNDPNYGRRTYVKLADISPYLLQATVATEDRNFYEHPGVDPIAILRAIYYNVTEGSVVSGASTITQQVARNVFMTPEERQEQSLSRKVREAILAVRLANQYSRDEILEVYVNQIYYGNLAYGIEGATQTYFGKEPFAGKPLPPGMMHVSETSRELTLGQAAMLAGLPQSPAYYDPYSHPERVKKRQEVVLELMVKAGYITQAQADEAAVEPVFEELVKPSANYIYPHFINFVLAELEANPPPNYSNIYEAGLKIQTSFDPELQKIAEEVVAQHVNELADKNVTNGALVAIQPSTGQILALVGSKDFYDDNIAGQINMAVAPRQPGSSIKPFVYLRAFEKGWSPSTIIVDEPVAYPDGQGGFYEPTNYDQKFHGPVFTRIALANSYNVPAVKMLEFVGVNDFKEAMTLRFGVTTLTQDYYGLALSLGAAEIPLVEMTGAYQAIADHGTRIKPYAIVKILDDANNDITPPRPVPISAIRAEYAYLITHVLADNEARAVAFGRNSALALSRPAAAKTGTTNNFRDNLVLGFTPDLVTGVWVGNADNSPMYGTTGLSGAGPIWHDFMERAHANLPPRDFDRPAGIIEREICADPTVPPGGDCPTKKMEVFVTDEVAANPYPTPMAVAPTPLPVDTPPAAATVIFVTLTPSPQAPEPTPTELAPTPDIFPTPIAEVTPDSDKPLICDFINQNEFTELWYTYQKQLGCPLDDDIVIIPTIAEEAFQGGTTFWRSDTDEVYIIGDRRKNSTKRLGSGQWTTAGDWRWDGSDSDGVGMSPPSGLVEPKRGFGWLWRTHLGGADGPLGWALDREYGFDNVGRAQRFERGVIFKGSSKVYVLLDNGQFFAQ